MSKFNIEEEIKRLPIYEYAFLKPEEVIFSEEVREICKGNSCGLYGSSWACPPAVGSLEECKTQCLEYKDVLIFTTTTQMKDSYDVQGWLEAREEHEKRTDEVGEVFRKHTKNPLILSTEGCSVCKSCTYPNEPCLLPEKMYPATEGYGILVMDQAQLCGIKYNNGINTVTYFSMIFFN